MSFLIRKIDPLLRYSCFVLLAISVCSCSLSRGITGFQPVVRNEQVKLSENNMQDMEQIGITAEDEDSGEEGEDVFSDIDDLQVYAERMGIPLEDTENNKTEAPDFRLYSEKPVSLPVNIIDIPLPATAYNEVLTRHRAGLKSCPKTPGISPEAAENKELLTAIMSWIGVPYKWGGCGKDGVDCSCFVQAIYREVYGIDLSRTSNGIFDNDLTPARKEDLQEGDIISFKIKGDRISHIGIYLKNNKFVHVSRKKGVIISSLGRPYFQKRFLSAGRAVKDPNYNIAQKAAPSFVSPAFVSRTQKSIKLSDLVLVKSLSRKADKKKLTVSMLGNLPEKADTNSLSKKNR
ncbi:MAG: hypothetical protein BWK80_33440 [Desulfobacteraceae bacterium IS3]|nr:MAG: hypothetical protein BWK80_33440 [Desulfobacteraceae bacterium IS3]